ncbi:stress-inducible pyridoxine biosynthesis protein [Mitosporidium daphniae]|uniref:pyridoxal 5'-phosphate synthase (glutamine hydrolyzing) n=1 Tax=Mitosporidium daphniae TaxID=1485682 RepID=A0A098VSG5_9MICR|nr:stress-inducible pyridoxine biosynthesis protein [Mitosporidium daphniae]KGG50686.1 stress-inducible pyridoxine biosynthesis protein [Mitosporidium daphniae]|eukprot:XP_013237113.1 stress-inducible pyridoxine biosynthesis protein [Mitosporidium daphniae]
MESDEYMLKCGLASMLKVQAVCNIEGGVIMDVVNEEQAKIAEAAGACAVMALEKVPADIRASGDIARMADPSIIEKIQSAVSIPVMAKVRIGHFVEAMILEHLKVDFIDESEVLTPADPFLHIDKRGFKIPFVCGCKSLREALRRINEGAAMIRTKGDAGTGNVEEAVRHARMLAIEIQALRKAIDADFSGRENEAYKAYSNEFGVHEGIIRETVKLGRLPVVTFAAGGIATPADAAMMMHLGMDGVFVGSGIFKSSNPEARAKAIVSAVANYKCPSILKEVSMDLGNCMKSSKMNN